MERYLYFRERTHRYDASPYRGGGHPAVNAGGTLIRSLFRRLAFFVFAVFWAMWVAVSAPRSAKLAAARRHLASITETICSEL